MGKSLAALYGLTKKNYHLTITSNIGVIQKMQMLLRFAKLYSEWDRNELSEFEALSKENINEAKKKLST
jgi:hypothetical protein